MLGANPRKSFSLHCVEGMLWKVLALTVWQQWGLSVWGPHSWLWKYDVVSRCIWGCTSLPLSVWSVFKPRRPTESFIMLPRGTQRLCGCIMDLWLSGFCLSLYYTAQWWTGNAPCLSLEDHQDWTARVLSSADTPSSSCRHPFRSQWELLGGHIFHSGYTGFKKNCPTFT